MYKSGNYTGDDRMCDLVCDKYSVLQVMSRFGIALGFGDKPIAEVCAANGTGPASWKEGGRIDSAADTGQLSFDQEFLLRQSIFKGRIFEYRIDERS